SALVILVAFGLPSISGAQTATKAPPQRMDSAYTAKIREYLQDPRITTELVDHLPASNTVPTPLKFLGRIIGTPGELTHARDIHPPEVDGPEMLIELAYRLVVEETPLVQNIRNNVITLITPVVEVDGREKAVDTYYWNKKNRQTVGQLPLMYWGKYVQHDNNRDGMGQYLDLTKNITRVTLDWTPTILHDLHEAVTYLYASTGTGPYNYALDPITVDEWWMLARK